MNVTDWLVKIPLRRNSRILSAMEKSLRAVPGVEGMIQRQYDAMLKDLEPTLKPYTESFSTFYRIPEVGRAGDDIINEMEELRKVDEARWKEGSASGGVYNGDSQHIDFLIPVYSFHSQSNPVHADL